MRLHWLLLLNILSVFLFTSPAKAGKLLFWDLDSDLDQLTFVTEEAVQPLAKLITNPAPNRLVIDLPGTNLGRSTINKSVGKAINRVRIGQFNDRTTRIVLELAPGYTIDPAKVKFKGISSTRWVVSLPTPQRISSSSPIEPAEAPRKRERSLRSRDNNSLNRKRPTRFPSSLQTRELEPRYNSSHSRPPLPTITKDTNRSSAFQIRGKGIFVEIDGDRSSNTIKVQRSSDRRRVDFYLEGILLPAHFQSDFLLVNRNQIDGIQFIQESISPPLARISLKVDPNSPDWHAYFSRLSGLVISPVEQQSRTFPSLSRSQDLTKSRPPSRFVREDISLPRSLPSVSITSLPLIDSLELVNNNSQQPQLLIKADRAIEAKINKNRRLNVYEIIIPNAKLAKTLKVRLGEGELGLNDSFAERQLPKNSPISNLSIRERDDSSVEIILKPALGVRIGEFNQVSNQLLALSMRQLILSSTPPPRPLIDRGVDFPYSSRSYRSRYNNRRSNQRVTVMLDPGHGGKDPGAVGIGRLQEKDIVLPISLMVRQFLEQGGVQVKMTRQSDYFISLAGRTKMANQQGVDMFVSIHANAINMRRQDVNGLETYYYESGRGLAQTIHNRVLRSLPINDRKLRKARFYVLRKSLMPAVLVEVGFVTGREDAPKLRSPHYRRQMARAIADGILEYINQN